MRVIFGYYSPVIQSFTPSELGVQVEETDRVVFQIRQRMAHLMFIPVFPIGKAYCVENKRGIFQATGDLEYLMRAKQTKKTPFWSFSLLIIAAIVFIGFFISETLTSSRYAAQDDNNREITKDLLALNKGKFKVGDYMILGSFESFSKSEIYIDNENEEGKTARALKIEEIKNGIVVLEEFAMKIADKNAKIDYFELIKEENSVGVNEMSLEDFKRCFPRLENKIIRQGNNYKNTRKGIQFFFRPGEANITNVYNANNYNRINGLWFTYTGPIAYLTKIEVPGKDLKILDFPKLLANKDNQSFNHEFLIDELKDGKAVKVILHIVTKDGKKSKILVALGGDSYDSNFYWIQHLS